MSKYVSSENGAIPITCNRTTYSAWEEFTWGVNADETITLQGNNNDFVSSEDGTKAMTCTRTSASGWESFKVNQKIDSCTSSDLTDRGSCFRSKLN